MADANSFLSRLGTDDDKLGQALSLTGSSYRLPSEQAAPAPAPPPEPQAAPPPAIQAAPPASTGLVDHGGGQVTATPTTAMPQHEEKKDSGLGDILGLVTKLFSL